MLKNPIGGKILLGGGPFSAYFFLLTFWQAAFCDGEGGYPPFSANFFPLTFRPATFRDGFFLNPSIRVGDIMT